MRKSILLFLFCLQVAFVFGQDYTNDWINYAQTYYKIPVVEEGVYKISYSDLLDANFPVDAVDPRTIQIFHRGIEISLEVTGQGDAKFDMTDFIQFYASGNDGKLDAGLYQNQDNQPHQYYNLYSDTTAYFLTWALDASNGKRIGDFSEHNVSNIPVEDYHFGEVILVNVEEYATGLIVSDYIQRTTYDQGEGWSGVQIQENEQVEYVLSGINGATSSGSDPSIEVQLMGRDDKSHNVEILVGPDVSNLRTITTAQFEDYATHTINQVIQWSDISDGGEIVIIARALGVGGGNDLISVNYVKITFPQSYDMESNTSMVFNLKTNNDNKSYLEVINKPANVELWDITDISSPLKIGYNDLGNDFDAIVPNTAISRRIFATNSKLTPLTITQYNFESITPESFNYVIISHQSMMQPAGQYGDVVDAYAAYRSSDTGGKFLTRVFDIEDVYNQFNYGERSPLAIRELMKYLVNEGNPQYLFIIGKGLLINTSYESGGTDIYYRNAPSDFSRQDLIPTAGVPGSDLTYTVGLSGVSGELTVPTGRITASDPQQVADYLDKVKSHELQPVDDLWRKKILHLSGGKTAAEQTRFRNYVDGFKEIAETHYLGGKVTSLKKQTSAVDEFINVTEEINNGLGLITFYGHSAPSVIDIDIGFASNPVLGYTNKDKYPMILVNGCNAGQVYSNGYLWAEDWILTPDKGAIGFIGNSYFSFERALRYYSATFYEKAFGDEVLIGKSIGNIQQQVIKHYLQENEFNISNETITQQMILQGDPAVAMFGASKPDYSTDNNSVYFQELNAQPVNALADSFAIAVISKNFGKTELHDLNVRVKRKLEDNSIVNYDTVFSPVLHQDTLQITIKNNIPRISGRNIFEIELDYVSLSDELNENNNIAVIEKVLLTNGTKNLLPYNFAIVDKINIDLITQSANIQEGSESRDYLFEIDTVSSFDSSYKKTETVSGQVVAKWKLDILPNDSITYYWRTKLANPKIEESDDWVSSSFTYIINGESGWIQKHRQQYNENEFIGLNHNDINDVFSFKNVTSEVSVTTYGADHPTLDHTSLELEINNQQFIYSTRLCRDDAINIVAFNKLTTTPYAPLPTSFNNKRTCGRTDQIVNNFTYAEMSGANDYLKAAIDAVEDGDIVVIFTIGDVQFSDWDPLLYAQIERVGGLTSTVNSLSTGDPYILVGRKGETPGTAIETTSLISPSSEQTISINQTITGVEAQGQMGSVTIGPSNRWESFFNKVQSLDDDFIINISAVDFEDNETLINSTVSEQTTLDISPDYPYLKLSYLLDDPTNLSAAQLQYWSVTYDLVPEGLLILSSDAQPMIVEEGKKVLLDYQFINISSIAYQSDLEVDYTLYNRSTGVSETQQFTIEAPTPGDTTLFAIEVSTIGKVGVNDVSLMVNPRVEPEQYYDNNQIQLTEYLEVTQDNTAPVIDVTFDGTHIANGDIVASNPVIDVTLYDDNQSIFITDTTSVEIFLKRECEFCDYERITFDSDSIEWIPANSDEDFRISFTPQNLSDSVYYLRVIASDASGNSIGNEPYEVSFTIDEQPSVRYYYPYPNPSIDQIHFSFELRGASPPDEISITIYDRMGGVVYKISDSQLRIGLNIIDFDWQVSDAQLSSGMYFYRTQVIKDGVEIPTRGSAPEIGKLLLYR